MADDRQTKLDLTISSVTPARLEQTRQEVESERQKLSPKPPPLEETVPSGASMPPVDPERLHQLDLIQDVQLILIEKYRLGTKLMLGAVALMILSLVSNVTLLAKNFELHNRVSAVQDEQQKLVERGAQIEKKTDETNAKVDETKAKVDETNQKVDQAVEAAPKIEIDALGKAKVVLPVRTSEPFAKKHKAPPSPTPSTSASAPPVKSSPTATQHFPVPSQLPIETKAF